MFRRQGVIDLHMAWQDIPEIYDKNLIGPDIVEAFNALSLTAVVEVGEDKILHTTT